MRHLLAHASGLPFDGTTPLALPGRRRVYSNEGFRVLGEHLAAKAEMPFADYVREQRSAIRSGSGWIPRGIPCRDGTEASRTCCSSRSRPSTPALVAPETHEEMIAVQFPGLDGVLPDFGRFSPLDWGLGVELKGEKDHHSSGARMSARTFGHFGGSGAFVWVDPVAGVACAALTTREFGKWAKEAWPRLSDAVLAETAA